MERTASVPRTWPATRLRLRAVVSATMVVGWLLAALSGLIPYFWLPAGWAGAGREVLGLSRQEWMSVHLWSSITMVAGTLVHVGLNRRGVTRATRVLSGVELGRRKGAGEKPRRSWKRALAWVPVVAVAVGITLGGLAFATSRDDSSSDGLRSTGSPPGEGRRLRDDPGAETSADPVDLEQLQVVLDG